MKKILICFLALCLWGCGSLDSKESKEFSVYNDVKNILMTNEVYDHSSSDFNIQVLFQKRDNDYRYDVVVNNPKITMKSIQMLCYGGENDDQMCPSIGIFDSPMNLKKDFINKDVGYFKGIQLSGTCDRIEPIRIYLCYLDEDNNKNIRYLEVNGREIR